MKGVERNISFQLGIFLITLAVSALGFEDPELLQHLAACQHPPGYHTPQLAELALHSQSISPIVADYLSHGKVG